MDSLVVDLRKKFSGCTPFINHIAIVDQRCIRVDYSTLYKLKWFEIWSNPDTPEKYTLLVPKNIRDHKKVTKTELLEFMKSIFVLPEK